MNQQKTFENDYPRNVLRMLAENSPTVQGDANEFTW